VSTAPFVGASVGNRSRDYIFQPAFPARRAGKRLKVQNADEKLVTLVK